MAMSLALTFTIQYIFFCMTFTGQSLSASRRARSALPHWWFFGILMDSIKIKTLRKLLQLYFFGCFHGKTDAVVCIQFCCWHVVSSWQSISHATKIHINMYKEHFTHSRFALRHLFVTDFYMLHSKKHILKLKISHQSNTNIRSSKFFHKF